MIDRQYSSYCFLASELSSEKKIKYSRQAANSQSMGFAINISHAQQRPHTTTCGKQKYSSAFQCSCLKRGVSIVHTLTDLQNFSESTSDSHQPSIYTFFAVYICSRIWRRVCFCEKKVFANANAMFPQSGLTLIGHWDLSTGQQTNNNSINDPSR